MGVDQKRKYGEIFNKSNTCTFKVVRYDCNTEVFINNYLKESVNDPKGRNSGNNIKSKLKYNPIMEKLGWNKLPSKNPKWKGKVLFYDLHSPQSK